MFQRLAVGALCVTYVRKLKIVGMSSHDQGGITKICPGSVESSLARQR